MKETIKTNMYSIAGTFFMVAAVVLIVFYVLTPNWFYENYEKSILPYAKTILSVTLLFFVFFAVIFDLCFEAIRAKFVERKKEPFAKDIYEQVGKRFFLALAAVLFVDAGLIVMAAFISPYEKDREFVRSIVEDDEFIEIYVKCSLDVCEQRDVKGFYKKARAGIIKNFTGIDDPYEEPEHPEIRVETDEMNIEESVEKIMNYLEERGYINKWKGESNLKETIDIK